MKIVFLVILCLFAAVGVFALVGGILQWRRTTRPTRQIDKQLRWLEKERQKRGGKA